IEEFRTRLYAIEQESKEAGGFQPQWQLVKISLAFVAALLGAYDPRRYAFYHHGKLRKSYEELVGPWPKLQGGPLYEHVCEFVQAVSDALTAEGVPVRDLIDAQSFLYLRAADDESPLEPTKAPTRKPSPAAATHLVVKWSPSIE